MKIAISDLEMYINCPRSYKLHVIEGVELERKSVSLCKAITARKAISSLHSQGKDLLNISSEEIGQICLDIWRKEISDPKVDPEELSTIVVQAKPATKNKPATEGVTKAERALENIITWTKNYAKLECKAKILYSNLYFEDCILDTVFTGFIDQIRETPQGEIQIVSFNTSSQFPSPSFISRDFHISLYSHSVWQGKLYTDSKEEIRIGKIPAACYYYLPHLEYYQKSNGSFKKGDLKGDPVIPASRSRETLLNFEYEILYAVSGIEIGFFPMNVNRIGCSLCHFSHQCKSAVEQQPYVIPEYVECIAE